MDNDHSGDIRRLRIADGLAQDEASRADPRGPSGAASLVCVVSAGSASAYCTVAPLTVLGTETAGSAGDLSGSGGSFQALNLGGGDPTGENVIVTSVGYRWVFRYD